MSLVFIPVFGWVLSSIVIIVILATITWHTVKFTRSRVYNDATVWMLARRWILAVVAIVMILGPSTYTSSTIRAVNATDVFIAVDVTGSMAVADAQYGSRQSITRIRAARDAVHDITDHYPDANFSAITFGASSTVSVPLTPDSRAIQTWADTLRTEPTNVSTGSSLDSPLNLLTTTMSQTQKSHPEDTIILYIITDGEQTTGEAVKSFSGLRAYTKNAVIIGVGSQEGGRIPQSSSGISVSDTVSEISQANSWVQDPDTGSDGISQMSESNLQTIADQVSGTYVHTDSTTTLKNALSEDSSDRYRLITTTRQTTRPVSLIWSVAIIFTIIGLWELFAWMFTSRKLLTL
ncbi:VWA domain-containing protein [Alloscardovia theropitheci]|uniref:VWA domain-containing protein n=1 Tax=Alloscardovia theropitheci TaxID=2496842 RepID=A0A4R0QRB7_9BIFI|nr:VWA domain-containing protein [Alloscardovia theropitheci]TCD54894.1 VWA domain-containing protein [Alloscardovia theropitheci]